MRTRCWQLLSLAILLSLPSYSIAGDLDDFERKRQRDSIDANNDQYLSPALAQNSQCTVIQRITAPDNDNQGLAWDSGSLWDSVDDYTNQKIYRISQSGQILSSFSSPGDGPMGLALVGSHLWNVDFLDDKIYKLAKSGDIAGSIQSPAGISSGLAWDGTYFWVSEWFTERIFKISISNGSIVSSLPSPNTGESPYGLAWDGVDLWMSDSTGIFKIDPNSGRVLVSCTDSDFRYGKAYGLTWDGTHLWGASWIGNEIIKISVPAPRVAIPATPSINIVPILNFLLHDDGS